MNVVDLAEDYLVYVSIEIKTPSPYVKDPKEGMRKLTASYLNEALQLEAQKQIQAGPYARRQEKRPSQ
jgi:hypothetical protein